MVVNLAVAGSVLCPRISAHLRDGFLHSSHPCFDALRGVGRGLLYRRHLLHPRNLVVQPQDLLIQPRAHRLLNELDAVPYLAHRNRGLPFDLLLCQVQLGCCASRLALQLATHICLIGQGRVGFWLLGSVSSVYLVAKLLQLMPQVGIARQRLLVADLVF